VAGGVSALTVNLKVMNLTLERQRGTRVIHKSGAGNSTNDLSANETLAMDERTSASTSAWADRSSVSSGSIQTGTSRCDSGTVSARRVIHNSLTSMSTRECSVRVVCLVHTGVREGMALSVCALAMDLKVMDLVIDLEQRTRVMGNIGHVSGGVVMARRSSEVSENGGNRRNIGRSSTSHRRLRDKLLLVLGLLDGLQVSVNWRRGQRCLDSGKDSGDDCRSGNHRDNRLHDGSGQRDDRGGNGGSCCLEDSIAASKLNISCLETGSSRESSSRKSGGRNRSGRDRNATLNDGGSNLEVFH